MPENFKSADATSDHELSTETESDSVTDELFENPDDEI